MSFLILFPGSLIIVPVHHNQIMDTHRNDSNSDVEDLDFINSDENIEISLEEEIFDEKSDPEDITIVDIESR